MEPSSQGGWGEGDDQASFTVPWSVHNQGQNPIWRLAWELEGFLLREEVDV